MDPTLSDIQAMLSPPGQLQSGAPVLPGGTATENTIDPSGLLQAINSMLARLRAENTPGAAMPAVPGVTE